MPAAILTGASTKAISEALEKIHGLWSEYSKKNRAGAERYVWDLEMAAEMLGRTAIALRQGRVPHYEGRVLEHLSDRLEPLGWKRLDVQDQILWRSLNKTIRHVQENAKAIDRSVVQIREKQNGRPLTNIQIDLWLTQMEHLAADMRIAALEMRRFLDD